MNQDPRRAIIEVMARLGKETQLHLDERHRHFKITDAVTAVVSFLLVVLAVFNIYYVRVLYQDMDGIVTNMDSMYSNLKNVDGDMLQISRSVELFDQHIAHMTPIHDNTSNLSSSLFQVRSTMAGITDDMHSVDHDMGLIGGAMANMDQRIHQMKTGMAVMRSNMRQMANPMSIMNPIMP